MSVVTAPVVVIVSGTAFTIDVTAANLLEDRTVKDFTVINTATDEVLPLANFTKDSQTQLSYSGPDVGTNVSLEVRRSTPVLRFQELRFQSKLSSLVLNEEYDRILRRQAEYTTYGVGPASSGLTLEPVNQPYGPLWQDDTVRSRTANVLYNQFESLIAKDNSQDVNISTNASNIDLKANIASPSFTGSPQTTLPADTSDDTRIPTTSWVRSRIEDATTRYTCIIQVAPVTPQVLPTGAFTQYNFTTEIYDPSGIWNGTGLFVLPVTGIYEIQLQAFVSSINANALSRVILGVSVNGAVDPFHVGESGTQSTPRLTTATISGGFKRLLNQGDVIRALVFAVTSVGNVRLERSRMCISYIGPAFAP